MLKDFPEQKFPNDYRTEAIAHTYPCASDQNRLRSTQCPSEKRHKRTHIALCLQRRIAFSMNKAFLEPVETSSCMPCQPVTPNIKRHLAASLLKREFTRSEKPPDSAANFGFRILPLSFDSNRKGQESTVIRSAPVLAFIRGGAPTAIQPPHQEPISATGNPRTGAAKDKTPFSPLSNLGNRARTSSFVSCATHLFKPVAEYLYYNKPSLLRLLQIYWPL